MEILEKNINNIDVVSLSGRLDAYSAGDLEKKLDSLFEAAHIQLIINFEQLEYISSSGLRVLLAALKKVKRQHGDIKLACLKPNVKEVFNIAGFTQIFNIFDTVETASKGFENA